MPSFQQILESIANAWANQRNQLVNSANEVLDEIKRVESAEAESEILTVQLLDDAFQSFGRSFDRANGGFGGAPKFPPAMSLEFLLRYFHRTKNAAAREMAEKTCVEMASGGIYDQLGGGFHRYSVDAVWLTPHFEKMLYDNAQLARNYLHLFQITKNEFYNESPSKRLSI
jgi:uncharacterized protein YyaL (SSP411 family)